MNRVMRATAVIANKRQPTFALSAKNGSELAPGPNLTGPE